MANLLNLLGKHKKSSSEKKIMWQTYRQFLLNLLRQKELSVRIFGMFLDSEELIDKALICRTWSSF